MPIFSPTFYVDAQLDNGATLDLEDDYAEQGIFVVDGSIEIEDARHETGTMIVFAPEETISIKAPDGTRIMLVGGAPLDVPRHIWWNFVSLSKDRLERAKAEWRDNPTGHIEGDDEFIPLPD